MTVILEGLTKHLADRALKVSDEAVFCAPRTAESVRSIVAEYGHPQSLVVTDPAVAEDSIYVVDGDQLVAMRADDIRMAADGAALSRWTIARTIRTLMRVQNAGMDPLAFATRAPAVRAE